MTNTATIRPAWTPLTIGLMVLGFVVFWPLGLAMLAYILWGDRLQEKFAEHRMSWPSNGRGRHHSRRHRHWQHGATGNAAFDDYRRSELERLEKERRRLEEERTEFEEFLTNLRRAKDQQEFDNFMSERAGRKTRRKKPSKDNDTIEL